MGGDFGDTDQIPPPHISKGGGSKNPTFRKVGGECYPTFFVWGGGGGGVLPHMGCAASRSCEAIQAHARDPIHQLNNDTIASTCFNCCAFVVRLLCCMFEFVVVFARALQSHEMQQVAHKGLNNSVSRVKVSHEANNDQLPKVSRISASRRTTSSIDGRSLGSNAQHSSMSRRSKFADGRLPGK